MKPTRIFFFLFFLVAANVSLLGCKASNLTRPYGYLRLGPLKDFLAPETFLESAGILIRHDQRGLWAMSTYCTYDLSPLQMTPLDSGERALKSLYTSSSYSLNGAVRTGPATHALPYFKLTVDSLEVQGPKDTLYVYIADEVSPGWRLALLESAPQ